MALWALEIVCEFGAQKRQKSEMSAESCAEGLLALISNFWRLPRKFGRLVTKVLALKSDFWRLKKSTSKCQNKIRAEKMALRRSGLKVGPGVVPV